MSTLGQRLKTLRGEEKQGPFAKRIGINSNTLRAYEADRNSPTADTILSICSKLYASPVWLLTGEGPVYRDKTAPPPPEQQPALPASGGELNYLRNECRELREENRELRQENRELRQENTRLVNENADLRIALEKLKPDRDEYGDTGGLRQSA